MRYMKMIAVLLVPLVLLLAGCGGGSSGTTTASNPFTNTGGNTGSSGTNSGSGTSSSGAIMFTDAAIAAAWIFEQLIPFKLTDANGNARVGVPVTLSVYSIDGDPAGVKIDFLVTPITEPNQQTVTTDSAGKGIFN